MRKCHFETTPIVPMASYSMHHLDDEMYMILVTREYGEHLQMCTFHLIHMTVTGTFWGRSGSGTECMTTAVAV